MTDQAIDVFTGPEADLSDISSRQRAGLACVEADAWVHPNIPAHRAAKVDAKLIRAMEHATNPTWSVYPTRRWALHQLKKRELTGWLIPLRLGVKRELRPLDNIIRLLGVWGERITSVEHTGALIDITAITQAYIQRDTAVDRYMFAYQEGATKEELDELLEQLLAECPSTTRKDFPTPLVDASKARERLDRIRDSYGAYMSDPLEILTYPALNDLSHVPTANFIRAYTAALDLSATNTDSRVLVEAIADVETTWQAAWSNAQRERDTFLPDTQRTKLRRAHALLATALDPNASPQEREISYQKSKELLEGVLLLPRQARASIELPLRALGSA